MKLLIAVMMAAASGTALAATETEWAASPHSETRLIAAMTAVPTREKAPLLVGWQVRLDPGWKTYWRTPGDAGRPPRVSWEGSTNVASVRFLYPFPERFEIFGLHTYGYHGEVIYPIEVEPLVAGAPMTLQADIEFLVCETLCVPAEQDYTLVIPAGAAAPSSHFAELEAAMAAVPQSGGLNATLDVAEVKVYGDSGAANVWVKVRGERLLSGAELILEDSASLRFGVPARALSEDPREAVFVVPVQGDGIRAAGAQPVTAVVSDGWGNALEKTLELQFNQAAGKETP
jgi:suppressor for copper-sensitivity B